MRLRPIRTPSKRLLSLSNNSLYQATLLSSVYPRAPEVLFLSIQIVLVLVFFTMRITVPAILGVTVIAFHGFHLIGYPTWLTLLGLGIIDLLQLISTLTIIIEMSQKEFPTGRNNNEYTSSPFKISTALAFMSPYALTLFISCLYFIISSIRWKQGKFFAKFPSDIKWKKKKKNESRQKEAIMTHAFAKTKNQPHLQQHFEITVERSSEFETQDRNKDVVHKEKAQNSIGSCWSFRHHGGSAQLRGKSQSEFSTLLSPDECYVNQTPPRWPEEISPELESLNIQSFRQPRSPLLRHLSRRSFLWDNQGKNNLCRSQPQSPVDNFSFIRAQIAEDIPVAVASSTGMCMVEEVVDENSPYILQVVPATPLTTTIGSEEIMVDVNPNVNKSNRLGIEDSNIKKEEDQNQSSEGQCHSVFVDTRIQRMDVSNETALSLSSSLVRRHQWRFRENQGYVENFGAVHRKCLLSICARTVTIEICTKDAHRTLTQETPASISLRSDGILWSPSMGYDLWKFKSPQVIGSDYSCVTPIPIASQMRQMYSEIVNSNEVYNRCKVSPLHDTCYQGVDYDDFQKSNCKNPVSMSHFQSPLGVEGLRLCCRSARSSQKPFKNRFCLPSWSKIQSSFPVPSTRNHTDDVSSSGTSYGSFTLRCTPRPARLLNRRAKLDDKRNAPLRSAAHFRVRSTLRCTPRHARLVKRKAKLNEKRTAPMRRAAHFRAKRRRHLQEKRQTSGVSEHSLANASLTEASKSSTIPIVIEDNIKPLLHVLETATCEHSSTMVTRRNSELRKIPQVKQWDIKSSINRKISTSDPRNNRLRDSKISSNLSMQCMKTQLAKRKSWKTIKQARNEWDIEEDLKSHELQLFSNFEEKQVITNQALMAHKKKNGFTLVQSIHSSADDSTICYNQTSKQAQLKLVKKNTKIKSPLSFGEINSPIPSDTCFAFKNIGEPSPTSDGHSREVQCGLEALACQSTTESTEIHETVPLSPVESPKRKDNSKNTTQMTGPLLDTLKEVYDDPFAVVNRVCISENADSLQTLVAVATTDTTHSIKNGTDEYKTPLIVCRDIIETRGGSPMLPLYNIEGNETPVVVPSSESSLVERILPIV